MKFNDAFWKWFGDSKIVDKNGDPLVVYHGTSAIDFSRFKRRLVDIGIHFGTIGQAEDRTEYMESHGRTSEGLRLIPVFLSIRNPLRLKDAGAWNYENLDYQLSSLFGDSVFRVLREKRTANAKTAACRDVIEQHGYDGVVYKNEGETAGASEIRARAAELRKIAYATKGGKGSWSLAEQQTPEYLAWSQAEKAYEDFRKNKAEDSWIAFHPSQIKSAVGNDGTWDSDDLDIRSNPRRRRYGY